MNEVPEEPRAERDRPRPSRPSARVMGTAVLGTHPLDWCRLAAGMDWEPTLWISADWMGS